MTMRDYCGVWLSAVTTLAVAFSPCFVSAAPAVTNISSRLQPYVTAGTLAGAVTLVATKDKILDLEAVGFADIAAKKPMQTDDLFWIASQSKPITATALMMLVDEGKVNVSDTVEKYLPEFKGQMVVVERDAEHELLRKPSHPITVHEILSHTSGLPFSTPIERPTLDMLRLRDAVRSYAMAPLEFEPGTKYQYSNAGINTAGRIIETVSKMPYEDFLDQRLFRPLGMRNTTFWPTAVQLKHLAKSYKPNAAGNALEETTVTQLQYPLNDRNRQPMPAGGLFSTARDLARFCQMILNGGKFEGKRYLSEAAVKQMTSKQTGDQVKDNYGFGWAIGDNWCGHGGAYSTNMGIDRRRGLIMVWSVQHAGYPGDGGKSFDVFKETVSDLFGH
jgi:CubicO group peptidase (beta-lactamase class C family)